MSVTISHAFSCGIADDPADATAGKVLPSHWNAPLTFSGLGTGVLTALGINVGSAGAFVTFNGALGTPSSGVATNLTGTASGLTAGAVTTNANLTGPITSVGNATSIASQTGTGTKFVVDTSPTLVTPILGVATATSLAVGNITATSNNTNDIGGSAARFRDLWVGRNFTIGANFIIEAGANVGVSHASPADGVYMLRNYQGTDFVRLLLGGSTSAFGAIARDGAGVKIIAADGAAGAFLSGVEQTAPSAPAADGYRIFAQDNGGGKTQLMVIFSSGAAQQIAIQP